MHKNSEQKDVSKHISWNKWHNSTFEAAVTQNRPIFLYLCTNWGHTVHLYERDVLMVKEVTDNINNNYIPIKIDPYKQPDVFDRYNPGGWPAVCLLTPSGDLLNARMADTKGSLLAALKRVASYWNDNNKKITRQINDLEKPCLPLLAKNIDGDISKHSLDAIRKDSFAFFDVRYNGFGRAPKYPKVDLLRFLLEDADEELRRLCYMTLETMSLSSICDHVGGGFFRSCDDEAWRNPNFEKLFCDNIELLDVYLETYRQTGIEHFKNVAIQTLRCIDSHFGDNTSLYYHAIDSDSDRCIKESYYGWTTEEIKNKFEKESPVQGLALNIHFGLSPYQLISPAKSDKCYLEQRTPVNQVAMQIGISNEQAKIFIDDGLTVLRAMRSDRKEPEIDGTFYTANNAKALNALGMSAIVFEKPKYLQRAFEIADIIWNRAHGRKGCILHEIEGDDNNLYLIDQVEVISGYLNLYRISGRAVDLMRAEEILQDTLLLLGDDNKIGCYDHTPREEEFGALNYKYTPFDSNAKLLRCLTVVSLYTKNTELHDRAVSLKEALEQMRPKYRTRDAAYGRALRSIVTPPPVVDLFFGEGVGELRKGLLLRAPVGTLIRSFDKDQETPWTKFSNGTNLPKEASAEVYVGTKKFKSSSDIDLILLHLNENI